LFYIARAASFGRGLNRQTPVSSDCSRKSFLARLGGLILAAGFFPRAWARTATASSPDDGKTPVALRPEQRAVARRDGSF